MLVERGHRLVARPAPRREEVDDHDAAAELDVGSGGARSPMIGSAHAGDDIATQDATIARAHAASLPLRRVVRSLAARVGLTSSRRLELGHVLLVDDALPMLLSSSREIA